MAFNATNKLSSYTTTEKPLFIESDDLPNTLTTTQDAYKMWQRIEQILVNGREQRVAYLLFHCGLTPDEIVHRCPQEFATLQEVLSLRCTIMKKLIRNM